MSIRRKAVLCLAMAFCFSDTLADELSSLRHELEQIIETGSERKWGNSNLSFEIGEEYIEISIYRRNLCERNVWDWKYMKTYIHISEIKDIVYQDNILEIGDGIIKFILDNGIQNNLIYIGNISMEMLYKINMEWSSRLFNMNEEDLENFDSSIRTIDQVSRISQSELFYLKKFGIKSYTKTEYCDDFEMIGAPRSHLLSIWVRDIDNKEIDDRLKDAIGIGRQDFWGIFR